MHNFHKTTVIILLLLSFISCQKVIDIDIPESEQRFIVEMTAKNGPGKKSLNLSKSISLYVDSEVNHISDAEVTVTDIDGQNYIFKESESQPGSYESNDFIVAPNQQYSLLVKTDNETLTATSKSFSVPNLVSISYSEESNGDNIDYIISYSFEDPEFETNYYKVNIWRNAEKVRRYYLTDDEFFNGGTAVSSLFRERFKLGDSVTIELVSIDESNYDYFRTLENSGGSSPFSAAPANVSTNINGGLGHFGTFTSDTISIVIQ